MQDFPNFISLKREEKLTGIYQVYKLEYRQMCDVLG